MNKKFTTFFCGLICGSIISSSVVLAGVGIYDVHIAEDTKLNVLGKDVDTEIVYGVPESDPNGYGKNYVSARDLAEALGYRVDWDGETKSISIKKKMNEKGDFVDSKVLIKYNNDLYSIGTEDIFYSFNKSTGKMYIPLIYGAQFDFLNELYNLSYNRYFVVNNNENPFLKGFLYASGLSARDFDYLSQNIKNDPDNKSRYFPKFVSQQYQDMYLNMPNNIEYEEKYYNATDTYFEFSFYNNGNKIVMMSNPQNESEGISDGDLDLDTFLDRAGIKASYHYDETHQTVVFDILSRKN